MNRDDRQGLRIAIVGGGIGGRSAMRFLRRAGVHNVTIYEQAPALREIGAGIQLSPNAVRLLVRLGLREALEATAVRLEVGWELRRWEDGRVLFRQELGDSCEREFGAPYYVMHRADLLQLLAVDSPEHVQLGRCCIGVSQGADDARLTFVDGSTETADVVIGADGIHSIVQGAVTARVPHTFSGLAAYRCLVPADRAPAVAARPVFTSWIGPGRHLVHYPVSGGREVNVVAAVPAGDWRAESWTAEGSVDDFAAQFGGWDERVTGLVSAAPSALLYAMYDREPLDRWVAGRVALLGDAAHPMLPALAQGACQAIEDAAVLAGCLRHATRETAPPALLQYEAARRERATRVQELSRRRQDFNHLPDGDAQRRRDEGLARFDPLGDNAWIYGHDAERSALLVP